MACADGGATTRIARRLHVSATTVCKWRARFLQDRLDGLHDEPRPGVPRTVTDEQEDIVKIPSVKPFGPWHWRRLAEHFRPSPQLQRIGQCVENVVHTSINEFRRLMSSIQDDCGFDELAGRAAAPYCATDRSGRHLMTRPDDAGHLASASAKTPGGYAFATSVWSRGIQEIGQLVIHATTRRFNHMLLELFDRVLPTASVQAVRKPD